MKAWRNADGKLIVGASGKPIICDDCPCEEPVFCCLYPFPDPYGDAGGPFYPDTDLPDSVVIADSDGGLFDGTYTRTPGTYIFPRGDGLLRINAFNGGWDFQSKYGEDEDSWGPTHAHTVGCLIGDRFNDPPPPDSITRFTVADMFSTTYTFRIVTGLSGATRTCIITRSSRCVWIGTITFHDGDWVDGDGGGNYHVRVEYPSPEANLYGWRYHINLPAPAGGPLGSDKSDPQSSPAGTYVIAEVL